MYKKLLIGVCCAIVCLAVLQSRDLLLASPQIPTRKIGQYSQSLLPSHTSRNERRYGETYFDFQQPLNKFGAVTKGDVLRHMLTEDVRQVLEFGCSGGLIIAGLPNQYEKFCVEINPQARKHAETLHALKRHVFARVPRSLRADFIYSTSVLEHCDCPLCELQKLKHSLRPGGTLLIGVKNDGRDPTQTFGRFRGDVNRHIYTWNELLLVNLLSSAGLIPCGAVGQYEAWHEPMTIDHYEADKMAYCMKGLEVGRNQNVYYIWSAAVLPEDEHRCDSVRNRLADLQGCKYLRQFS